MTASGESWLHLGTPLEGGHGNCARWPAPLATLAPAANSVAFGCLHALKAVVAGCCGCHAMPSQPYTSPLRPPTAPRWLCDRCAVSTSPLLLCLPAGTSSSSCRSTWTRARPSEWALTVDSTMQCVQQPVRAYAVQTAQSTAAASQRVACNAGTRLHAWGCVASMA